MSAALNLPPMLAKLGKRVPGPFVSLHFVAGLELARRLKWLEPPAELNGRTFAITVEDLGLRSSFVVRDGAFRPLWNNGPQAGAAELELGAKLADFLALMRCSHAGRGAASSQFLTINPSSVSPAIRKRR